MNIVIMLIIMIIMKTVNINKNNPEIIEENKTYK